jgi:hypothetical protein
MTSSALVTAAEVLLIEDDPGDVLLTREAGPSRWWFSPPRRRSRTSNPTEGVDGGYTKVILHP